MIAPEVESYSYLWNGEAPEWYLSPLHRQTEAIIFFKDGISGKDILKLKNIVSKYAVFPTSELLSKMKGVTTLSLGVVSGSVASDLESKCKQLGVELRFLNNEARYVIVNDEKNCILAIEDNDVYKKVIERMLKAGVQVRPDE